MTSNISLGAMNSERRCLFTGHRGLPMGNSLEILQRKTQNAVRDAYRRGYRDFYAGGAVGFDMLAAVTVLNLRQRELPGMTLTLALPHFGHYKNWSKANKNVFAEVLGRADQVVYVSEDYAPGCMHLRNRYMVDRSSLCICFCGRKSGGTAYTVRYAEQKGLKIVNLFGDLD